MSTPREIDTELAGVWTEMYRLQDRLASNSTSLLQMAGAEFYYRGRRRVTDMTVAEAIDILEPLVEAAADDEYGYGRLPTRGSSSVGQARTGLSNRNDYLADLADLQQRAEALEGQYTGWSRFFLVTSSSGHVHSSMSCSSCRHTTRYGWLPELSGKSEGEAVDELGPTLCTFCFPSAPVEWTEGKKLTRAQAERRAA